MKTNLFAFFLALSLAVNVVIGYLLFEKGSISKYQINAYSIAISLLNDATQNSGAAEKGKDVTKNLVVTRQDLSQVSGILRGLNADAINRGINFTPIIDALEGYLDLPFVHTKYSENEKGKLQNANKRLQQLMADLKGTTYNDQNIPKLRAKISYINSYVQKWGY